MMKNIYVLIFLGLFLNMNLLSQENWENISSHDSFYNNYQILHKSSIIQMARNNGDFKIFDLEKNEITKEGSLNLYKVGFIISDGDYIYLSAMDNKLLNSKVIKYDSEFNFIEEYKFPISSVENNKITKTSNGTFVITGYDNYFHSPFLSYSNDNFETFEGDYYPLSETHVILFYNIGSFKNSVYTGSDVGDLYESKDDGKTWENDDNFKSLDFGFPNRITANDNFVHITGYDGQSVIKFDNNENWSKTNLISDKDVNFFGSLIYNDIIFLSGANNDTDIGYIYMSKDYGDSWELIFENPDDWFNSIFVYNKKLIACTWEGDIYSTDIEKYTSVSKSIDVSEKVIIEDNEIKLDFKNKAGLEIISVDGKIVDKSKYNVLNDKVELNNLSPGNYILNSIYKKLQFLLIK